VGEGYELETVLTVSAAKERQTVETVFCPRIILCTRLKPGENEKDF
jgi:hypothetical protein